MIDSHSHPEHWGIKPVLFQIGDLQIQAYSFFVLLGLAVGLIIFFLYAKRRNSLSENSFYIVIAGLIGGVLGAKIPIWIIYFPQIIAALPDTSLFLSGRTIVGGLIGGTLAVWIVKRKLKLTGRIGNSIAPAVAIGIAIGRLGCFFRGCCYGQPTNLPWGVNFGDEILRHPTQLYETFFLLTLFIYLHFSFRKNPPAGTLFDKFLLIYFSFRFIIEFIRVEPKVLFNLTAFQYASLLVIIYILVIKKKIFKFNQKQ
jgi:phosphatidylglycerol:prolipoprotein diacylglycerol transferase